jgi:Holliday junction DNA helicase RuvA
MYSTLRGKLLESRPLTCVVEAHGVGYKVFLPVSAVGKLPQVGKDVFFYTTFVIRENLQALYAFLEKEERDLFEVLLDVTGIGPKTALSLIGHLPPDVLSGTIAREDSASLSKVPGVGQKTAERLIVELRGKFSGKSKRGVEGFQISFKGGGIEEDAECALVNLGYSQSAAEKAVEGAVKRCGKGVELAALIAEALKK